MNPGADAAEQVVRLSLEGAEVAARITGAGAKNTALLLAACLKEEQRTKGKTRLTGMLKSGRPLKVYTLPAENLKAFSKEAKRYGVLYCVLKDRNNPGAPVDIIARADDASKVARIMERFELGTVNPASLELQVQHEMGEQQYLPAPEAGAKEAFGQTRAEDGRLSGRNSTDARESSAYGMTKESVREKLGRYREEVRSIRENSKELGEVPGRLAKKITGKDR